MKREVDWSAVLVVASAVAVAALCGYLLATWPPTPPSAPPAAAAPRTSAPATPSPSPSESGSPSPAAQKQRTLAVLGDSFTATSTASDGPEWPDLVGDALTWRVASDAVDDSGYVTPGEGKAFPARVQALLRKSPDVVVLAGGYHDVRSTAVPDITAAADRIVTRLQSKAPEVEVVLVSPFSAGAPGPLTLELSQSLRQVAEQHDVGYVDATGWLATGTDLIAQDGVHPTDQGQQRIATRMERALKRLDLTGPGVRPTG